MSDLDAGVFAIDPYLSGGSYVVNVPGNLFRGAEATAVKVECSCPPYAGMQEQHKAAKGYVPTQFDLVVCGLLSAAFGGALVLRLVRK